jgi:predicted dinucleotide-binding enzyme
MKVTVIGAGNMGRGIGTRVLAGGHSLQISTAIRRRRGSSLTSSERALPPPETVTSSTATW